MTQTSPPLPRVSRRAAPLAGMRILAVEQYGAGPFGTSYLADLGAEVIKIENPAEGGDVGRHVGPHFFGPEDSHFFQTFNRNKRSLTLDLKQPEGLRVFQRLVTRADAVLDNLRGDLPARLGITYDALKAFNPRIVCTHLSAYGREGSRAAWPGYDYLMQAEAGHMMLTGEPDGPPTRYGLSIVDLMTGLVAAFGLLAAVCSARTTGIGSDVDTSLFDVAIHNLNYPGTWYLNAGATTARVPRSGHPSLVPSQLYRTEDGWIFVMCNKEKFWPLLCNALGREDWATDPRFRTFKDRLEHRDILTSLLDSAFMAASTEKWIDKLSGTVPVAPVLDIDAALGSAFVHERGGVQDFERPDGNAARLLANPIRIPGTELPARAAPALGADNLQLLHEVGFSDAEIDSLRDRKVISGPKTGTGGEDGC